MIFIMSSKQLTSQNAKGKQYMSGDMKPMDRHKIAANFMCSILKARVIRVNRLIPNLPIELLMANEYLAFYVAVSIVENYKRDLTGNEDYILDLFPETYIENEGFDSYIQNTCKALFYIKRYEIKDIFAYANLLFWLEKYTDVKIGIET